MVGEAAIPALGIHLSGEGLISHAPAKINLFLHVLGRRADGYHDLESLVTFADIGDTLRFVPERSLSLQIDGPFAASLPQGDNLILKAAHAFEQSINGAVLGAFYLTKNLPIASGIGGGSSDAAAALRLLAYVHGLAFDDARVMACAASLGADVPICMECKPRIMRGIGHDLGPALAFYFDQPILLVNPGIAVASQDAFTALGLRTGESIKSSQIEHSGSGVPILGMLSRTRNDLEAAAIFLGPEIGQVLLALRAMPSCQFARMSGSGATCFGLFETDEQAQVAGEALRKAYPHWWISEGRIKMPF